MAKSSLIKPPSRLSDKVRKTGGPSSDQAILRAVGAVESMMEDYQGWAVDDLQKLVRGVRQSLPELPILPQGLDDLVILPDRDQGLVWTDFHA